MSRLVYPGDGLPDWLVRGSGSYPVPEGLTILEVQRILEVRGFSRFRCDEAHVTEHFEQEALAHA